MSIRIITGAQVPYDCVVVVSQQLQRLTNDPQIILELVKKCQNENYQWTSLSTNTALQILGLVKQNGTVDQDIKKVVLCSVRSFVTGDTMGDMGYKEWLVIVNPINGSNVTKIEFPG